MFFIIFFASYVIGGIVSTLYCKRQRPHLAWYHFFEYRGLNWWLGGLLAGLLMCTFFFLYVWIRKLDIILLIAIIYVLGTIFVSIYAYRHWPKDKIVVQQFERFNKIDAIVSLVFVWLGFAIIFYFIGRSFLANEVI
jgi:hypothetical protein